MQPYFFPYIGYFDLINRTDRWVVFDVVKYTRKSWMNRNRILKEGGGWQYITVPVDTKHEDGNICDVTVIDKDAAKQRILSQLQHYRKARAPFFSPVRELVSRAFDASPGALLRDLNVASLTAVCDYVGIPFHYDIFSQMGVALPPIAGPGDWALEISAALGAREYINPPGGRGLFDRNEFEKRNIALSFTEVADFRYETAPYPYEEALSILDVLMWNSPQHVKTYLDGLLEDQS